MFVEILEVEDIVIKGVDFGVVEFFKVVFDLIFFVNGEVLEVNEKLEDELECINEDLYENWILKVKLVDVVEFDMLLSDKEYEVGLE